MLQHHERIKEEEECEKDGNAALLEKGWNAF
jgi:hypothetical protein